MSEGSSCQNQKKRKVKMSEQMGENAGCLGMVIVVAVLVLGISLFLAYDPEKCVTACGEGQVVSVSVLQCVCK